MDGYPWWNTARVYQDGSGSAWSRTIDPAVEPITIAEVRQHARIVQTDDDASLQRFIRAGREEAEDYLGRGLLTQTWQLALPLFYEEIPLPMAAPLQTVTSVQYYDTAGTLQTLATSVYIVDTIGRPGRIQRASGQAWPAVQADRRGTRVLITYVVGWTAPAFVPERIKQGIRLYVTAADANREGMDKDGQTAMQAAENCWTDRVRWVEPTRRYPHVLWPV